MNPLVLWHGGHNWQGPPSLQRAGKGRSENGSGLYLTTSGWTARKYAKGGGTVIRFEVDPALVWLSWGPGRSPPQHTISIEDMEAFLKGRDRLRKRNEILADLRGHAVRVKRVDLSGDILENLMFNSGALTGDHGPALAEFFVRHGIDASYLRQSNEDWIVLYNLDKILSWRKAVGEESETESPRLERR